MNYGSRLTQESAGEMVARHEGTLLFAQPQPAYAFAAHMREPNARALSTEPGICQVVQDFFTAN